MPLILSRDPSKDLSSQSDKALGKLVLRLQYSVPQDYLDARLERDAAAWPITVGGASPVPGLGFLALLFAGLTGSVATYFRSHARWRRYRSLVVEIYEEGLFVFNDGPLEVLWSDIESVTVTFLPKRAAPVAIRIRSALCTSYINDSWPGIDALASATIRHAHLHESTIGNNSKHEKTYVR